MLRSNFSSTGCKSTLLSNELPAFDKGVVEIAKLLLLNGADCQGYLSAFRVMAHILKLLNCCLKMVQNLYQSRLYSHEKFRDVLYLI